jgi:hypothetical protein
MTKSIAIALLAVAAVATLTWLCRRKPDEEPTASPSAAPPEAAEEKKIASYEDVPQASAELTEQPQPAAGNDDASGLAPVASLEFASAHPESVDTSSEPDAKVRVDAAIPDTPPSSEAFDGEVKQTTAPPPIVTPTPEIPNESPNRPRVTRIRKPEPTRHVAPERRGGGQMEEDGTPLPAAKRKRVRSGPQLRLVCFKGNDRMWRVAVELPEDFLTVGEINVSQDGQLLEPVRFGEPRWPLKRLTGSVEAAEARNGGQRWEVDLGDEEYWLFKLLVESETEEGRLVSAPSRGDYLVIVPENWPMPASSGLQLSRERNIGVDRQVGYRFTVHDSVFPRLEFGRHGFQREAVQFRSACFALAGERADAEFSEYQSSVFLKSPPSVRSLDPESWSHVHKVILGVAGKGCNKWKSGFKPNPTNNEIQLSKHLDGRTGGWYFVRLYDANEVLMDSLYFVFAEMLRSLRISGGSALPAATGHAKALLEFEHDRSARVEICGQHEPQPFDAGTACVIPPRCDCERVDWQLTWPGQPPLRCTTRIERVWWALGSESAPPTDADWTDRPATGKRAHFFAASDKVLFIRLPCTSSIGEFGAGFARGTARSYAAIADKRCVPIPLRDFTASSQVHSVGMASFGIWVWRSGQESFAETLRLEIVYECGFCSKRFSTDDEALAHAVQHEKEFIRELTYEELRRLDPDLPPAIYQCSQCGWYVRADNPENPTSAIIWHVTHRHPNPHGPTHVSYRSVTDLDEIRGNVERHLPQIFRCKCGERFENVEAEEFAKHIFRKHRNQLFSLV